MYFLGCSLSQTRDASRAPSWRTVFASCVRSTWTSTAKNVMTGSSASSAKRDILALIVNASPVRTDLGETAKHARPGAAQFAAKVSSRAMAIAKSAALSSIASSNSALNKGVLSVKRGTTWMKAYASRANKPLPDVNCATRRMLALSA